MKMNRRRLVVLLEEQIYIYDISNMKLLHTMETAPNPGGICALSPSSENSYLVYPSAAPVAVNVGSGAAGGTLTAPGRLGEVTVFDTLTLQPVNIIEAHKSALSVMALNNEGTLLATASDKGTIIRIFSVATGAKLYQFRRGTYPSKIYSLNFNLASTLLAVSSATGTVHIFKLARQPIDHVPSGAAGAGAAASPGSGRRRSSTGSGSGTDGSPDADGDDDDEEDMPAPAGSPPRGSEPVGMDAIVEQKRRDSRYTGMLRRSSQTLGRQVAGAVGGYLPASVTDMWEAKTRDFAFFKLPVPLGTKSVVALSSFSQHALVITSDGLFFQYAIDLEKGGECELVKQYSLLDTEVD